MWTALTPLTNAVPEVVQGIAWFVSYVATPIVVAVSGAVMAARRARKKAEAAADKPTIPPPAPASHVPVNPFAAPPPTDPYLHARIAALEGQASLRQQWVEGDLRRALAEASTDLAQKTRALLRERELRKAAEVRLAGKEQQLATLEAALNRVTRERDQAELELAAARAREVEAASAIPPVGEDDKRTPLRPPPRRTT